MGIRLNAETHGLPQHHRIDELWKHASPYIEDVSPKGSHDELETLQTCINEFCSLDPEGMAFRYPVDRAGKPHLPEWTVINLRHLGETMEKIGELLDGVTEGMYVLLQQQNEVSNEY